MKMCKAAGLMALCFFATISSSTLALESALTTEVRRVPAGQMIHINCSLRECNGMLRRDVVELRLTKWSMAKHNLSRRAVMTTNTIMDKTTYDTDTGVSGAHDMNVTESLQELSLAMSTSDVETGDAYKCDIFFWKDGLKQNVSCITQLEVAAPSTLPESTTGVTRAVSSHDQGASPQIPPTDEREMTGSVSLPMVSVGMMAVAILLLSAILFLIILLHIRRPSGDFPQKTTQLPPEHDTVEALVATEPIYSVIKKKENL